MPTIILFINAKAKKWEELNWFFNDILYFEYALDFDPEVDINNNNHAINIVLSSVNVTEGWSENFIQVGFQINGNSVS